MRSSVWMVLMFVATVLGSQARDPGAGPDRELRRTSASDREALLRIAPDLWEAFDLDRILFRASLLDAIFDRMCAPTFSFDEEFDGYYPTDQPGVVQYRCERNVETECAAGYNLVGMLVAQSWTLSYECQKAGGGGAGAPSCAPGFDPTDAKGSGYTCTRQQPQASCYPEHWRRTVLDPQGTRVTYLCWGTSY